MTNKTITDLTFEIGATVAMKVFNAPYEYLPWNEKLACRIVAAFVIVRTRLTR